MMEEHGREAINMTSIREPEWRLFAISPTNGITLEDGTLFFPSKVPEMLPLPIVRMVARHGRLAILDPQTNGVENAIVQLSDGSIMLNARSMGETNCRTVYTTPDLGATWIEHPTNNKVLIEPGCHGSLYKHTYSVNGERKAFYCSRIRILLKSVNV
ncbi:MAG: sialidase family protein [Bacteroidales bacterium]|nr:sialidase family protein [Bacteroidales bacterium]